MTGAPGPDVDGLAPPALETVVSYARFLEIRQRRARVIAELTQQPVASPSDDWRPAVVIDVAPITDARHGGRTTINASAPIVELVMSDVWAGRCPHS